MKAVDVTVISEKRVQIDPQALCKRSGVVGGTHVWAFANILSGPRVMTSIGGFAGGEVLADVAVRCSLSADHRTARS
ncbi:UNVERIFIED_CONTAM: hypothetical protein DES50_101255 [Williamsia faeni]